MIVFVTFILLAGLWNWATETKFWTPFEMAISAVLTVVFFGGLAWLITNVGMALLYRNDPGYRAYRRSGGDPYFDSLPSPINPDSEAVAKPYWGQGIVTEVVRRLCEFSFDQYGLRRIYAQVFATNPASARVLEKAGFELEGTLRSHHFRDGEAIDVRFFGKMRAT